MIITIYQVGTYDKPPEYDPCWSNTLAVDPSLNVFPCPLAGSFHIGNLLHDSIQDIVRRRQKILEEYAPKQLLLCKECEWRNFCKRCKVKAYVVGLERIAEPHCYLLSKARVFRGISIGPSEIIAGLLQKDIVFNRKP